MVIWLCLRRARCFHCAGTDRILEKLHRRAPVSKPCPVLRWETGNRTIGRQQADRSGTCAALATQIRTQGLTEPDALRQRMLKDIELRCTVCYIFDKKGIV